MGWSGARGTSEYFLDSPTDPYRVRSAIVVSEPLPQSLSRIRTVLAAWLLCAMSLIALLHGMQTGVPAWLAGIAAWGAAVAVWPRLDRRQRRFVLILVALGAVALALAVWLGASPNWTGLLTQNTALLGMLVAVSFLHLAAPVDETSQSLPRGRRALWQTLASVHVFGAVINMSMVFIAAERIASAGRLSPQQAATIARSFLAAALWSPFFAAMAVALTYAPGARLAEVALAGVPLALGVLWLAGWSVLRLGGDVAAGFVGFPMHPASLWLPLVLTLAVVAGHAGLPGWTSLAIISAAALLISVVAALVMYGLSGGGERVAAHAGRRLPTMSGELLLFLAAGVFATGLQALMQARVAWMPFDHFGPMQAAIVLAVMIALAAMGIHAVVTIVIASAWLMPLAPDPLLLAMVFLMAWGIGLSVNPMAGVHLSLQGRFGLSALALARDNVRYCMGAYAMAVVWLTMIGYWRGQL